MGEYRYRENAKRGMAFVLAIILGGMAFLPGFPVFPAKAAPASGQQTTLTTAHGDAPMIPITAQAWTRPRWSFSWTVAIGAS